MGSDVSPSDAPRALVADSPNAVFRERERPLPADRFASVRERIADGPNRGFGAVEPGETLDDAARREVREESGVEISVGAFQDPALRWTGG
jgi:8-oxo-dGTP pyrophosphatase MutT (NUDIX family)